jgi:ketosteroid isomerase-like protein
MSHENVELTRSAFDAFNGGDLDAVTALHHPAIEWQTSAEDPDAAVHHGKEAVRRYFEQWLESFPGLRNEVEECFEVSGDRVFMTARWIGQGSASGVPMDWRLSVIFTFRDGTVIRAVEYFDRAEALQAVGLQE